MTVTITTRATRELREAWRSVANAKLTEYRKQAWRLRILAEQGIVNKADAIDQLWTIGIAHSLLRSIGEDRLQAILAEAFADTDSIAESAA